MRPPVVLLDADGVFLRTLHPGNYFEHHYGISKEDSASFGRVLSQCLVGQADLLRELPRFLEAWHIQESAVDVLHAAFSSDGEIDPSVAAVVKAMRARGIACALVTNQDRRRMAYLDQHLAIRTLFDAVFVSCEMGLKKPDPAFYHAISARYPEHNLLFWDDRRENVSAATACGWTAFVFRDAGVLERDFIQATT